LESGSNITQEKAYAFALRIVKLYKYLTNHKKEFILSKQILRSGTSIGANVAEANGAISNADFSAKISIAYKEALETKYWLKLLFEAEYIAKKEFESLHSDCDELCKIFFSILKTTRIPRAKRSMSNVH
jgi:four helix bundle protein